MNIHNLFEVGDLVHHYVSPKRIGVIIEIRDGDDFAFKYNVKWLNLSSNYLPSFVYRYDQIIPLAKRKVALSEND